MIYVSRSRSKRKSLIVFAKVVFAFRCKPSEKSFLKQITGNANKNFSLLLFASLVLSESFHSFKFSPSELIVQELYSRWANFVESRKASEKLEGNIALHFAREMKTSIE